MLLPPEYAWFGLVLMGSIFVFVSDMVGNTINFENRLVNAFTTAIVFSVVFAFFVYFRYGCVMRTGWGFVGMSP